MDTDDVEASRWSATLLLGTISAAGFALFLAWLLWSAFAR
jgi:hypothetical protein